MKKQVFELIKSQIYLISNGVREYHYLDYSYIINDEIQKLLIEHNLIIYKNFLMHTTKKDYIDSIDLQNNVNIGTLLGFKYPTHYDENCRRLINGIKPISSGVISFHIVCDNLWPYAELALHDYGDFNIDESIKHIKKIQLSWSNVLLNYGYKEVKFLVLYYKKYYDNNPHFKSLIDKIPIENRFELEL